MLWLFEGYTAYFDNLLLVRSGVIDVQTYLNLLAEDIARYRQTPGREHQTLAQSSYEAWTKLYNGGEDTANSSTSYYIQGALAAWSLDAWLRAHSDDGVSLQMLMHRLWHDYHQHGAGLDEERFLRLTADLLPADVTGVSVYDQSTRTFRFHPGPIFAGVVVSVLFGAKKLGIFRMNDSAQTH